jgi:hypothetical protein
MGWSARQTEYTDLIAIVTHGLGDVTRDGHDLESA